MLPGTLHAALTTSLVIIALLPLPSFSASGQVPATVFEDNFEVNWAPTNVRFLGSGGQQLLQLVLDNNTGSGFASKDAYLFGNIDMQIKLIPGNSAGTVTAYYMSSETSNHDELDFEFLGNKSGQPYILQTNVFANGVGGREQRIYLWFDPTADFHSYSVSWTKKRILFLVDGIAIRVFSNNEAVGKPYLNKQPMRVFSSIWNGDSWATRGGRDKIDWTQAPFVATYRNFGAKACVVPHAISTISPTCRLGDVPTVSLESPSAPGGGLRRLRWVKSQLMVYDYCTDRTRYPTPPVECSREF